MSIAIDPSSFIYNLKSQLIEQVRTAAGLTEEERAYITPITNFSGDANTMDAFIAKIKDAGTFSPESQLRIARAMAGESIVRNALENMYRTITTPTPQERFETYFENGLKGKTEDEQKAFVGTLEEAKKKMVLNVVQTMHPTIYHTAFGRDFETDLTDKLEEIGKGYKKNGEKYYGRHTSYLDEAKGIIEDSVKAIMDKDTPETVTPNKQVTVAEENALDKKNHIAMQHAFGEVVDAYNNALKGVANELYKTEELPLALNEKMCASTISEDQAVWRTWAYGADADGRDQSTSVVLWSGINHQVNPENKDKYISRKRDLRENAKDQKQTVNALIQRAFWENDDFEEYCKDFHAKHETLPEEERLRIDAERLKANPEKDDAYTSTVLQLAPEEQKNIFRDLLVGDFGEHSKKLAGFKLVPDSLSRETVAFNTMFSQQYRQFIEERHPELKGKSLPDINLLSNEEKRELEQRIAKIKLPVGENDTLIRFKLDMGKDSSEMLYYPKRGDNQNFLSNAMRTVLADETKKVKDKDGKEIDITIPKGSNVEMSAKERRKVLDVVKRLEVLNYAIDTHGAAVADRYQIANFADASDFYSTLLLFKETGILETEKTIDKDGKELTVVKKMPADETHKAGSPKLSIQPLLETEEDQAHAPALFRKLLEDPLVESYYKALGNRADIMVGYSDGAKSAGNMASEWSIIKCKTELKKIFEEHEINVNFFDGRGRGDSRGGQFDEGQNFRMSPPEVHQDMRYDETMQSDSPMKGAISENSGKDTLTSIITGILTAKQESDIELKKRDNDPVYKAKVADQSTVLDGMTQFSSETYVGLVRDNENTDKLLAVVPDNIFKSSRPGSRGTNKKFEDQRAIGVEYGFAMADAPLHYIGMRKALESLMNGSLTVRDEQGKEKSVPPVVDNDGNIVTGQRALEALYQSNAFFHNMIDKTARGLRDYDPAVFMSYAKVAGIETWAQQCIDDLNGLRELTLSIARMPETIDAIKEARSTPEAKRMEMADRPENFPQPLSGKKQVSLADMVKRGKAGIRYEARGEDTLREEALTLSKCSSAMALSTCLDEQGNLLRTLKKGERSPMKTDEPMKAEILNQLVFVKSEGNRMKGARAPASITAAVDHVPYLVSGAARA